MTIPPDALHAITLAESPLGVEGLHEHPLARLIATARYLHTQDEDQAHRDEVDAWKNTGAEGAVPISLRSGT